MPGPFYLFCIPGVAIFFIIQILICEAYHFHTTVARARKRKQRRWARGTQTSSCSHTSHPHTKDKDTDKDNHYYPGMNQTTPDGLDSDDNAFISEVPKDRPSQRARRKSVFAESYDPSNDVGVEKIINPKSPEERQWLIDNVRNVTLFQHLADDQLTTVVDAMYKQIVNKDETIMNEGDKGTTFYVIQTGVYNVYKRGGHGSDKTKLVHTYDNQGSFGELALMYNQPRAASVVAQTNGVLWAVDGVTFRRIVNRISYKKRVMYEGLINNVQALTALEPHERANLVDCLIPLYFQHNEVIMKQGEEANGMFFLVSGGAKLVTRTPKGKDVLLREYSSGEYFGERALLTNNPRVASAYAVGPTHVALLERETFERLLGPCLDVMRREVDKYDAKLSDLINQTDTA